MIEDLAQPPYYPEPRAPWRHRSVHGTVIASEDGAMHFFDDIYGQDRRLEALLGLAPIGAEIISRVTALPTLAPLPEPHPTRIDVHEIGGGIKADAPASH